MRRRYLVCYDIRDPGRLRRTHRTVLGYGYHLQYSVYVCDLSGMERQRMLDDLKAVIDQRVDSVVIFDLGLPDAGYQARRVARIGPAPEIPAAAPTII